MVTNHTPINKTSRNVKNRGVILALGILILCFSFPTPLTTSNFAYSDSSSSNPQPYDSISISSASDNGNDIESTITYSREIQGLDFSIMNDFTDTLSHQTSIDFSQYHIAGWSLYDAAISVSKITALSEHEIVGASSNPNYTEFTIIEHSNNLYYNQLAQGFYDMDHEGKLENISLLYYSRYYDPVTQNYAYFDIRSDYQNGSTNMVSSVQLENVGYTPTWVNVTEAIFLEAGTTYFAVVNGTKLVENAFNRYPEIHWFYVDGAGAFSSRIHNTDGDYWGSRSLEALLNYTYIPWNTTSNSALEFQNPQLISLEGNSSALIGSEWSFSSSSNITNVQFSSNQSVSIEYDIILSYKQNITSTTSWYADTSNTDVVWNITSVLDFPELSGSQDKNLTLILPDDWTASHLFNITTPMQYYDHFNQIGTSVECTNLADETWILECTSPNYIQSLSKFDTSDDSVVYDHVSVSVTLDLNSTIEDSLSTPVSNGNSYLRIFHESTQEYSDNVGVTAGTSHHQWDISLQSTTNGLHAIELYWVNGTEVGYHSEEIVVYYPTTLSAESYSIDGFTESTVDISVYFEDTFTSHGLNGTEASVVYSFAGESNTNLTDHNNGTWTASISTSGRLPDTYEIQVFAEGYAIENNSVTITTTLIHDTKALTIQWLDSNNISFIDTTELRVQYTRVGDIPVANATVNVTIDGKVILLTWDSDLSLYRITFNGTDSYSGFDTYNLTIKAWKVGHKAQVDITQNLTIHHEYANFTINWSHGTDITYIEYTILTVSYQMSNSSAIPEANVSVTDGITTWPLHWNGTDGTYWIKFNGTDSNPGYGTHSLIINASKFGYESHENPDYSLIVRKVPTSLVLTWSNGNTISYVETTTLVINYTMLDGSPVIDAIVNVTVGTDFYTLDYNSGTGTYNLILNGSDINPGLGDHLVTVLAGLIGHDGKSNDTYWFTIDLESTTLLVSGIPSFSISYVQYTTLNVTYLMSDGTPIEGAIVNVTINGHTWNMTWDSSSSYLLVFNGTDTIPGFGIHNLTILASRFGYESRSSINETLDVHEESTIFNTEWSGSNNITYVGSVTLYVDYQMSNTTVISNATVTITIGPDVFVMEINETSGRYWYRFNGDDLLPGMGIHSMFIEASKFGYEYQSNPLDTLTIDEEPTTLILTWSNTNSITYINSTTLIANFTQSDGSPVIGATVNVTVGTGFWEMDWNNETFVYELTFNGTDAVPGFGTFDVTVLAGDIGFIDRSNDTENLIVTLESTSITITWSNTDSITFVEQTTLIVSFKMSNNSVIPVYATVNVTIGDDRWDLEWDNDTDSYRITFLGSYSPPGLGTHNLTIMVGLYGYENHVDPNMTLTLSKEPTSMTMGWLDSSTITYLDTTILVVDYRMSNNSPILNATVSVTINGITYPILIWHEESKTYRYTFIGSDNPPGLGFHIITVNASRIGYESIEEIEFLTINEEPTTIDISWSNNNTITFLESTVLIINYTYSDGTPVIDAIVNGTIDTFPEWDIVWDEGTSTYRVTFSGFDNPPGFGTHNITIRADKFGYLSHTVIRNITLEREPTTLDVRWANDESSPAFFSYTYLIVDYLYDGSSPVMDADLSVSINSYIFEMEWNVTGFYQLRINGSDSYLGIGTNSIAINAGKYGYVNLTDSSEEVVIPVIPTNLELSWLPSNGITYVQYTILRANYTMYNGTPVLGASVNVTINEITLSLNWSSSSKLYERTFYGSDSSLGIDETFTILVEAVQDDFQFQSNIDETLTIDLEPTTLVISWIGVDNITYFEQTTLSVQFIMSNGTSIKTGLLNATIGGVLFPLNWNNMSSAHEIVIYGNDDRLEYQDYVVLINASAYGYVPSVDTYQYFTIRLEDTWIEFEWVPLNTISYLDSTVFRIYYRYSSDNTSVIGATVNATYGITWIAVYNETSEAYEIVFTGSDLLNTTNSPYTLDVYTSKDNHYPYFDNSQSLIVVREDTLIEPFWLDDDNTISFVESTTIYINYSIASSGASIVNASVTVRIGAKTWPTVYNNTLELYAFTFTGDMDPPGLGTFTLYITATYVDHDGFMDASNNTMTLEILSESVDIHSYWIGGNTITYVDSTILVVNYTMSNGSAIPGATINVTIGSTYWILPWHDFSQTYQMIFNGTDSPPGLGYHELNIRASRDGFDTLTSTLSLEIIVESSTVTSHWSDSYQNDITYFEYTYLFVEYSMSSGSPILNASISVTIDLDSWMLEWNSTAQAYSIRFNGSDVPPGFGNHTLVIDASKFGYAVAGNLTSLEINKDPTSIEVIWSNGYDISFVENTTLMVYYRMSDGSPILTGIVEASIGGDSWNLTWNETAQAYCFTFNGTMNPPGIDRFTIEITAVGDVFASQYNTTDFEIHEETTSVIPSWITETIDWTESLMLYVEYRDSYGRLIAGATQKVITIDGVPYTLNGWDGTYWFEFNNNFNVRLHLVEINISKYGYEFASNTGISINITEASTDIVLLWNSKTIDYLGQIELFANYSCNGSTVPYGDVAANITIDGGIPLPLEFSGEYWVINLTGVYLDLGPHTVTIKAQAYGYNFAEITDIFTVDEVVTDALSVTWNPSNVTIEYTDSIGLVVDYTYYGGDVPDNASVDVTINGQIYNLNYSSGAWRVSINGSEIDIGLYDAFISASLHGYVLQTNITIGVNVTAAANWFHVEWEPSSLIATYIDTINISVIYTQDFEAIDGASVYLSLNGTLYELVFSSLDEKWHFSIDAATIDLGVWNATVTANKTGYANGYYTEIFTVVVAPTIPNIIDSGTTIYYDETSTLDIYYQLTNLSVVSDAVISFTLNGIEQPIILSVDHWHATLNATELGVGVHTYTIMTSSYGYETQVSIVEITVLSIPTSIILDAGITTYAREFISFRFTYYDDRSSTTILANEFEIIWSEYYDIVTLPNNTYVVTIGGIDFHVGNYTFQLTLGRMGFDDSAGAIDIAVQPINTYFVYTDGYVQFENETAIIDVQLRNSADGTPITWAYIVIELEGVGYVAIYDSEDSTYRVTFRLPLNIAPGTYNIDLHAEAEDCLDTNAIISFQVIAKRDYVISLDVPAETQADTTISISVSATEEDQSVSNIPIRVSIIVHLSEGGQQVVIEVVSTNTQGLATILFEVPSDAIELEISASFQGSISEWPAESATVRIDVIPSGAGGAPIFENPLMLTIVAGGVALPLLALAFRRRKRGGGRVSAPVSVAPVAPVAPPASPLSEMQKKIRDEIVNNEEGVTRAELSRRLGPSASKIGAMVKDLLNSDSGFYEVREGAKKLIKFRNPD